MLNFIPLYSKIMQLDSYLVQLGRNSIHNHFCHFIPFSCFFHFWGEVFPCANIPAPAGEENSVQTIWHLCCKCATCVDSGKSSYLYVCQYDITPGIPLVHLFEITIK